MIVYNTKAFTARILVIAIGLCWLAIVPLTAGCSPFSTIKKTTLTIKKTTKRITNVFDFSNENLKKKVGLALFENKTLISGLNFEETFPDNLATAINEACPDVLLVKPGEAERRDRLVELPRQASGRVDTLALAKAGRQLGYNAIVTGALIDLKTNTKKSGILLFKDTHYFIQVKIMVEVYDTETGAKLLDESYLDKIEVETTESEPGAEYTFDIPAINEALLNLANIMGEKICESVSRQPWQGYIVAINGDEVAISSGSEAGLNVGQILEVYDSLKIIEGANNQRFFIPGLKTGEIKITAVDPDRAKAVAVSGNVIWAGSTVKLKE